jgi:uncharacterized iron-regulated protein
MAFLKKNGFDILFMEHLYYDDQALLDSYFGSATSEMPDKLKDHLQKLDARHRFWHICGPTNKQKSAIWQSNNFSAIVQAAKQAGIRIVALDTEYEYSLQEVGINDIQESDIRNYSFNFTANKIIRAEMALCDSKTKWCALMGSSHVERIMSSIPGVAELTGARSLSYGLFS